MANRGRPRKPGVKRTPSGRISQSADAQQENVEPILTRMRLFGLSEQDARDQKASTFIGRLQLMKAVNQCQYDAAVEFLRVREAYLRAIKAPDALRTGAGGSSQAESPQYGAWCKSVIGKYDACIAAVRQCQNLHQNRGSNLYAALDYVVSRDQQMWHMVGDARLALNALAHHFGLMGKRSAHPFVNIAVSA